MWINTVKLVTYVTLDLVYEDFIGYLAICPVCPDDPVTCVTSVWPGLEVGNKQNQYG